jgi:hypothetical protein
MRLILKATILSLTLFTFSLILNGCVEEPTIDPAYRLSSVIRVVNVSNNQNNIKVTIAEQTPVQSLNAMAIGSSTEFFDFPAGKKVFRVYDESGQMFFSKDIEITSFELMTIVFAGHYDPDPEVSTFSSFELAEGETYISHAPAPDTSLVNFVHASAPVDTFNSRQYRVAANYIPNGSTVPLDTTYNADPADLLEFGRTVGAEIVPGSYTFSLYTEGANGDTVSFAPVQMEPNFRYYMFLYGNPNNVQMYVDKVVPPAIRSRD